MSQKQKKLKKNKHRKEETGGDDRDCEDATSFRKKKKLKKDCRKESEIYEPQRKKNRTGNNISSEVQTAVKLNL